jgi:hypothetical protein
MKTGLFWVIMQRVVVISYMFGTTYWSHPQGSRGSLNPGDGINRLSKTQVRNYHYSLHNNLEKHSSHILHGGWMISSYHMINVIELYLIKICTK